MSEYLEGSEEELKKRTATLEQFISDSFFGHREKRKDIIYGEYTKGQVTTNFVKTTDGERDHFQVVVKNPEGEEIAFLLLEDKGVLTCDDGKDYQISPEQITILKLIAKVER